MPSNHKGFTLIELILSMVLSLLIFQLLLQMYVHVQKEFMRLTEQIELLDHAQSALNVLKNDIARAGYIGCARLTNDFPLTVFSNYTLYPANRLVGYAKDRFIVRHMSFRHVDLQNQQARWLMVRGNLRFKPKDIAMISDCKQAEIFFVENVERQGECQRIYLSQPLARTFSPHVEVGLLEINRYFIEKSLHDPSGNIKALFVEDIHGRRLELVDGIEYLNFNYLVDKNGTFQSWKKVSDWKSILAVNIQLEMRSKNRQQILYESITLP